MTDALDAIFRHWPTLGLAGALLVCVYFGIRTLALTFEHVGNVLGPLGAFWRSRRTTSRAEVDDLQRRIEYLDHRVRALLHRDNCYFDYMVYDAAYHHRQELLAAERGWRLERHVPFLEFRLVWVREHGIENESNIWQ